MHQFDLVGGWITSRGVGLGASSDVVIALRTSPRQTREVAWSWIVVNFVIRHSSRAPPRAPPRSAGGVWVDVAGVTQVLIVESGV